VSVFPVGLREGAPPAALAEEVPRAVAPLEEAHRVVRAAPGDPAAQAVRSRHREDLCLSARKVWSLHFGRQSRVS
jgi:hypothetical protein